MIKTKKNNTYITKDFDGKENGKLVPIFNIHDSFFKENDHFPKQFYMTTIKPKSKKGPHKHFIRQGCFCCLSGNVKIVLKVEGIYEEYYSGENHDYLSIIIPRGVAALLYNESESKEAIVINMPDPAWTPDMDDEHTEDFSDYV